MAAYQNYLTINHRTKPIPYGGDGVLRDDGDANYGFRYVKGKEAELQQIPELLNDPDLCALALLINGAHTGLFTVGSVSGHIADEQGHRDSGYIEFAINSKSAILDARSYFSIFFHFDQWLFQNKFPVAVSYNWELQPATFIESGDASGFTCCITVNTHYSASREEADKTWSEALSALGQYLASVPPMGQDFIYL